MKAFLGLDKSSSAARGREGKDEDEIVRRSLQSLDPEALSKAGVDVASLLGTREKGTSSCCLIV